MEKKFFEILSIGEQVEIINDLDGLKKTGEAISIDAKTETVMKALRREKFRFDLRNKLYKITKLNKKHITSMDIDELISRKLTSAINLDELSSQKLANALNLEELSNQKLINAINVNDEAINLISEDINELKEMLNDQKQQSLINSRQESTTNVSQAINSLPKTIETLERTLRINLEVAKNFDEFYKENKEFRVQDLISLALQELINKYK